MAPSSPLSAASPPLLSAHGPSQMLLLRAVCAAAFATKLLSLFFPLWGASRAVARGLADYDARTPLHIACASGHLDLALALIRGGTMAVQ